MTKEQINEGNKLIEEFMKSEKDWSHLRTPRYNASWDWLMRVVEKIEGIDNSDGYEVDIFGRCCDIGGVIETVAENKIEATFIAVVKFIAKANGKEWILD